MTAPWWTAADQAELDVLVAELVLQVPVHKAGCAACTRERTEGWPCPAVTEAIEAVLDWRWRRGQDDADNRPRPPPGRVGADAGQPASAPTFDYKFRHLRTALMELNRARSSASES